MITMTPVSMQTFMPRVMMGVTLRGTRNMTKKQWVVGHTIQRVHRCRWVVRRITQLVTRMVIQNGLKVMSNLSLFYFVLEELHVMSKAKQSLIVNTLFDQRLNR